MFNFLEWLNKPRFVEFADGKFGCYRYNWLGLYAEKEWFTNYHDYWLRFGHFESNTMIKFSYYDELVALVYVEIGREDCEWKRHQERLADRRRSTRYKVIK